jgi:hypothetical protein
MATIYLLESDNTNILTQHCMLTYEVTEGNMIYSQLIFHLYLWAAAIYNRFSLILNTFVTYTSQKTEKNWKLIQERFGVLMAVTMKNIIFWDVTLCSLIEVYWCFRGMYCLHLQGWFFDLKREQYIMPKQWWTTVMLHGTTSQVVFLVHTQNFTTLLTTWQGTKSIFFKRTAVFKQHNLEKHVHFGIKTVKLTDSAGWTKNKLCGF